MRPFTHQHHDEVSNWPVTQQQQQLLQPPTITTAPCAVVTLQSSLTSSRLQAQQLANTVLSFFALHWLYRKAAVWLLSGVSETGSGLHGSCNCSLSATLPGWQQHRHSSTAVSSPAGCQARCDELC